MSYPKQIPIWFYLYLEKDASGDVSPEALARAKAKREEHQRRFEHLIAGLDALKRDYEKGKDPGPN